MRNLDEGEAKKDVEILKAVAQAWHAHGGNADPSNEFDARRPARSPLCRASRFKLEAAAKAAASWDFSRSLWDSYEIVAISKQLENCDIGFDQPIASSAVGGGARQQGKRPRESKNRFRSLFSKASFRGFSSRI